MRVLYKVVIFCASGLLSGIFLARFVSAPYEALLLVLIGIIAVSVRWPKVLPIAALVIGVMLGFSRAEPKMHGYDQLERQIDQKVVLWATVIDDPVYHESGQFQFNANDLHLEGQDLDATVRVRSYTNDIRRGDKIQLSGKLRDGFAYWQASLYYAQTEVLERDDSALASFRRSFISSIYSVLPDPEASLGLGFLMGVRSLLPEQLVDQLSITGLTHIVAVSGYNLTILVSLARGLFQRGSRFQAMLFTGLFIAAFVTITGWSPSILRATVVSALSIVAWYYGRRFNPWLLLLYSSAISALLYPAYAWFDVGWYLSLSAFAGVLILAPILKQRFFGNKRSSLLRQIMLETSSAQLMTLPIIMLVFGEISMIALFANLLVLPLIPLSMLLTFLVGIVTLVEAPLLSFIAIPTYLILRFVTNIIGWLSNFDWALTEISMSRMQLLFAYGLILLALWLFGRHRAQSDIL